MDNRSPRPRRRASCRSRSSGCTSRSSSLSATSSSTAAYIFGEAIGPRYWTGYTEDDVDIIIKSLAYLKGPMFLDCILPYFTTPWSIPDRLDLLSVAELAKLQTMVSIRAMVESMTMPPEKALDRVCARLTASGSYTPWHGLVKELRLLVAARTAEEAEQRRMIKDVTTLSPTSIERLIGSYRVEPSPGGVSRRGTRDLPCWPADVWSI